MYTLKRLLSNEIKVQIRVIFSLLSSKKQKIILSHFSSGYTQNIEYGNKNKFYLWAFVGSKQGFPITFVADSYIPQLLSGYYMHILFHAISS